MNMHLKIFDKNGTTVTDIRASRKRRILHFIQADKTSKARHFIRVYYSKGFANCEEYDAKECVLLALNAFTEK